MTPETEHPALAHIERTLGDAYRKEIDQEENIWRSLPFFAATLALELATLFQLVERLPPHDTSAGRVALGLLGVSSLCSLSGLCFLAASIFPARFSYLATDTTLLDYAEGLIQDEALSAQNPRLAPIAALPTLKRSLAVQYAQASNHNRRINKRREWRRSIAGLLTIAAVISTLFLVGTTFMYSAVNQARGAAHEAPRSP